MADYIESPLERIKEVHRIKKHKPPNGNGNGHGDCDPGTPLNIGGPNVYPIGYTDSTYLWAGPYFLGQTGVYTLYSGEVTQEMVDTDTVPPDVFSGANNKWYIMVLKGENITGYDVNASFTPMPQPPPEDRPDATALNSFTGGDLNWNIVYNTDTPGPYDPPYIPAGVDPTTTDATGAHPNFEHRGVIPLASGAGALYLLYAGIMTRLFDQNTDTPPNDDGWYYNVDTAIWDVSITAVC